MPPRPYKAVVRAVQGRRSLSSGRGLAPVHGMTLEGPDGLTEVTRVAPQGDLVRAVGIAVANFREFEVCPICLETLVSGTREHVPQEDLGGQRMTITCARCNNTLGTYVEPELRDWFDDAVGSVRLSGAAVTGRRKAPRVLLRNVGDKVALVPDGPLHPDLRPLLESGQFDMEWVLPDRSVWAIAALKHAYLGACLVLGRIPHTPLARQIRHDLIAVRDTPDRDALPASECAEALRINKTHAPASSVSVGLVEVLDANGARVDRGLLLAGTLFISWPLEEELIEEVVALGRRWPTRM